MDIHKGDRVELVMDRCGVPKGSKGTVIDVEQPCTWIPDKERLVQVRFDDGRVREYFKFRWTLLNPQLQFAFMNE